MILLPRWALRPPRARQVRQVSRYARDTPLGRSPFARSPRARMVPRRPQDSPAQSQGEGSTTDRVSDALRESADNEDNNNLLAPVHIPEDPNGVLKERHPATSILANSSIIVQRQLELMNVLVGFEQANRYVIMDPRGNHIGYLAEQEHGIASTMARQLLRTHRSFTTHVFDRNQREVLRFYRPFSWINSRIRVFDPLHVGEQHSYSSSTALESVTGESVTQISPLPLSDMRLIGEAQQQWAPLRRKYNMFLHRNMSAMQAAQDTPQLTSGELPISGSKEVQITEQGAELGFVQFAYINEPFLSWDFSLLSAEDKLIGSVNRNFVGFAREIFTDTGVYALRMDSAGLSAEPRHLISRTAQNAMANSQETPGMTLDQRAVMLATAVSIDFDYFSRHSSGGGVGFFPWFMPFPAEASAGGAAGEAGAAGAAGATGSDAGAIGNTARGLGAGEGAIAGAGTMAGYEAMKNRREQGNDYDDNDPSAPEPYQYGPGDAQNQMPPDEQPPPDEVWGKEQDPWDGWGNDNGSGGDSGGDWGGGGGDSFF